MASRAQRQGGAFLKFGVLQFFSWPERRVDLNTVYERALDRVKIMDTSGYDAVWLAEHHFSTYSVCPSVHLMAMHIAHITEHIRIGMAVSLAAFYHPLRLAEEVALLDVLSGGRVNWGAGRGFDQRAFGVFGFPPDESYPRFRECVEIVLAAWSNDKLNYQGKFWNFEDIEVLPKPQQDPLPYWIASSSPDATLPATSVEVAPGVTFPDHTACSRGPIKPDCVSLRVRRPLLTCDTGVQARAPLRGR